MGVTESPLSLEQCPCTNLSGVGSKVAENLAKLQIHSIQDLLFHLPIRYQDRTHITALRDIKPKEYCVIEGIITNTKMNWQRKPTLSCEISDGTGKIHCRFFHFNAQQQQNMQSGFRMRCFGEIRYYRGEYTIIHPEYQIFQADKTIAVEEHLTPIYSTTEGLGQKTIRQLIGQALTLLKQEHVLQELLPPEIHQSHQLCDLKQAILFVHEPPPDTAVDLLLEGIHPMQQRLAFEELIAHRAALRRIRHKVQQHQAPVIENKNNLTKTLIEKLPFALTNAQSNVVAEINVDLNKPRPMMRLIQGDVGSGKTIVALLAILNAVDNGYQAAMMAPTEILAEQHYLNFKKLLEGFDIHIAWLSGKLKARDRNYGLSAISGGQAKIIVGTHALFQKEVQFKNLGLIVIDEQHRFGVDQRMTLRDKGEQGMCYPHQLVMTATPIPRTLAMTAFAEMDFSVIDELPPGRTPVTTVALPNSRRNEIIDRVKQQCLQGHQTYWVCTLIEESEVLQCQAAEDTAADIQQAIPELTVGLIHGRQGGETKEATMAAFKKNEINLLVATTVIEVGVDVPNASLMIIENPERLGLSQLHQLRGRVGRGHKQSHCVLLYQPNLSEHAKSRLAIMRETSDGFLIAQRDLELRGPGEVLGTRQTGALRFKVADIMRDKLILSDVKHVCEILEQNYPEVIPSIINRWFGENEQYGRV